MAFESLVEFHRNNGHCNVPHSQTMLSAWVRHQRHVFWNPGTGDHDSEILSNKQITKLATIGFDFGQRSTAKASSCRSQESASRSFQIQANKSGQILYAIHPADVLDDNEWHVMFKGLCNFGAQYGHFRVPHDCVHGNRNLSHWLQVQKMLYHNRLMMVKSEAMNGHLILSKERAMRLGSIGLFLGVPTVPGTTDDENFQALVIKLDNLRRTGGHDLPNLATGEFDLSASFTVWRRFLSKMKKAPRLSESRLKVLAGMGFQFPPPVFLLELDQQTAETWEYTYRCLALYHEYHGHSRIPKGTTFFEVDLYAWICQQQVLFQNRLLGRTPYLSSYRIRKLQNLDFDFGITKTSMVSPPSENRSTLPVLGTCQGTHTMHVPGVVYNSEETAPPPRDNLEPRLVANNPFRSNSWQSGACNKGSKSDPITIDETDEVEEVNDNLEPGEIVESSPRSDLLRPASVRDTTVETNAKPGASGERGYPIPNDVKAKPSLIATNDQNGCAASLASPTVPPRQLQHGLVTPDQRNGQSEATMYQKVRSGSLAEVVAMLESGALAKITCIDRLLGACEDLKTDIANKEDTSSEALHVRDMKMKGRLLRIYLHAYHAIKLSQTVDKWKTFEIDIEKVDLSSFEASDGHTYLRIYPTTVVCESARRLKEMPPMRFGRSVDLRKSTYPTHKCRHNTELSRNHSMKFHFYQASSSDVQGHEVGKASLSFDELYHSLTETGTWYEKQVETSLCGGSVKIFLRCRRIQNDKVKLKEDCDSSTAKTIRKIISWIDEFNDDLMCSEVHRCTVSSNIQINNSSIMDVASCLNGSFDVFGELERLGRNRNLDISTEKTAVSAHTPEPSGLNDSKPSSDQGIVVKKRKEPEKSTAMSDTVVTASPKKCSRPSLPSSVRKGWLLETSKVCFSFRDSGRCRFGGRCKFWHSYTPMNKLESYVRPTFRPGCSVCHPSNQRHLRVCSRTDSHGNMMYTAGFKNVETREIFYAERGRLGSLSTEGVWWYRSEKDALAALDHVIIVACGGAVALSANALL